MTRQKIVISANLTIEPIFDSLRSLLKRTDRPHAIVFAPYNQIFQQLLDPSSLFGGNVDGVNVIYLRFEDLLDGRAAGFTIGENEVSAIGSNALELLIGMRRAENLKSLVFVFLCPHSAKIVSDAEPSAACN